MTIFFTSSVELYQRRASRGRCGDSTLVVVVTSYTCSVGSTYSMIAQVVNRSETSEGPRDNLIRPHNPTRFSAGSSKDCESRADALVEKNVPTHQNLRSAESIAVHCLQV